MRNGHLNLAIGAASGLGLLLACTPTVLPNPYLTLTENVLGVSVGGN